MADADVGALAWLRQQWPGLMIWRGNATGRWWAMDRRGLVDAPTPRDLDAVLMARMGGAQ